MQYNPQPPSFYKEEKPDRKWLMLIIALILLIIVWSAYRYMEIQHDIARMKHERETVEQWIDAEKLAVEKMQKTLRPLN